MAIIQSLTVATGRSCGGEKRLRNKKERYGKERERSRLRHDGSGANASEKEWPTKGQASQFSQYMTRHNHSVNDQGKFHEVCMVFYVGLWRLAMSAFGGCRLWSASGDWQCRPLAAVGCGRPPAGGIAWATSTCRLCRPLAALLWCHFPERDTFGCLGAAAADQGAVLAGFARQG